MTSKKSLKKGVLIKDLGAKYLIFYKYIYKYLSFLIIFNYIFMIKYYNLFIRIIPLIWRGSFYTDTVNACTTEYIHYNITNKVFFHRDFSILLFW